MKLKVLFIQKIKTGRKSTERCYEFSRENQKIMNISKKNIRTNQCFFKAILQRGRVLEMIFNISKTNRQRSGRGEG